MVPFPADVANGAAIVLLAGLTEKTWRSERLGVPLSILRVSAHPIGDVPVNSDRRCHKASP